MDYREVTKFGNLTLRDRALVDASGGGTIQLQGKNISLLGDSVALIQNRGIQAGGLINVVADNLELQSGTNGSIISSLEAHTLGIGASGRIEVVTQQLKLQDGAKIATRAFSPAAAGNITVNASQSISGLQCHRSHCW
jgi:hypothetical protein